MNRDNPALASLLGLALGDAYGRPLEFSGSPRTAPAGPGHHFVPTDDTWMSVALAQAIAAHGPGPLDEERFGRCVGEAFVRWADDPRTPTTAPGNTCLSGVARWRRCRDWRTSGIQHSDGCGAVMRIAPLAWRFSGDELDRAAHIQAVLTHGHPNASTAAIAGARLMRALLDGTPLTPRLVRAIALRSEGSTQRALLAAVERAAQRSEWLEEHAIPDHDGGWRSPSALGLAVLAALRWGAEFQTAIDRAARINGDSDSVAALCGMLLGAAGGLEALPSRWLHALAERDELLDVVPSPLVAVADLHGRPDLLRRIVAHYDARFGEAWTLVTLGDYVDNGPDIPGLLEEMLRLSRDRGPRFVPILGNHDLACLRVLGFPHGSPDPVWYQRWHRYWDPGLDTPSAYGARSAAELARHMPRAHQQFLAELPWYAERQGFFFVHAGLQRGPIGPQREQLARRELPAVHTWMPTLLRDKTLATVDDPTWERIVVSAHTKLPHGEPFVGLRRICLSGDVDRRGTVQALELHSGELRRF